MCGSMFSCLFVVLFASYFAFTSAKPMKDNEAVLERLTHTPMRNAETFNGSNPPDIPMMASSSRQALYPTANGLGYHNLQQLSFPSSHYPTGWPYSMQQMPLWNNNMQFKDNQHTDARTIGHLRPSLYSQYQTYSPQSYIPAPITPAYQYQPYEYATPGLGHYSGYPSWYRNNAEELKSRQFWNALPPQPIQPSISYASNYLFEKPVSTYSNIEGISQPQMYKSMPMLIGKEAPARSQLREADSAEAQFPQRGANIMVDNQYNMQIPQDYLLQKLQGFSAPQMSAVPQHEMWVQPQMIRAAEQSQLHTMEYTSPMLQNQQANFKDLEINQKYQDPYVTPQDQVIFEPSFMPEAGHVQGSRAAELEMPTWYNYRQQLRMAQLQGYNEAMNNVATHIEFLDRQYVKEKEMMDESRESTSSHNEQLINKDMAKNTEQMQQNSEKKFDSKLTQVKDAAPVKANEAAGITRN